VVEINPRVEESDPNARAVRTAFRHTNPLHAFGNDLPRIEGERRSSTATASAGFTLPR